MSGVAAKLSGVQPSASTSTSASARVPLPGLPSATRLPARSSRPAMPASARATIVSGSPCSDITDRSPSNAPASAKAPSPASASACTSDCTIASATAPSRKHSDVGERPFARLRRAAQPVLGPLVVHQPAERHADRIVDPGDRPGAHQRQPRLGAAAVAETGVASASAASHARAIRMPLPRPQASLLGSAFSRPQRSSPILPSRPSWVSRKSMWPSSSVRSSSKRFLLT